MASQVSLWQTREQIWQPMHSWYRIWTGGRGRLNFSFGAFSMQSTGQKGTQTWQPVQLSESTTAMSLGFFFLTVILSGSSGMFL